MRKLREAAVVAAVIGSAGMIGTGTAAAHGGEQPPEVTIHCVQNNGDETTNTIEVNGLLAVNLSDVLNGGDADASSNQQVCGLENKNVTSTAGDADGGTGLDAL